MAIAIALSASTANAKLPREVGRAFLDAGIPLNHVGIVVQETTKLRPLFEHDATHAFGHIVPDGKGYSCEVLVGT